MKHATQTPAPATGDGRRERVPEPGAGSARRRFRRGGSGQQSRGQRAGGQQARGQWAAWAFLVPVVVYLVAFYVYPL
ncbi:hypothetical protein FLX08_40165, partial [Microbispora hainanensis]